MMLENGPLRSSLSLNCITNYCSLNEVDGTVFLGAVDFGSTWTKCAHINGVPLSMKVDTGADVTAIPKSVYRRTTPNQYTEGLHGQFSIWSSQRTREKSSSCPKSVQSSTPDTIKFQPVFISDSVCHSPPKLPLLGWIVIRDLHLFNQIDAIPADECSDLSVFETFPSVFSVLGQFIG